MNSCHRPNERQGMLFPPIFPEFDFESSGSARTHYGKAGEEVACDVLKLYGITINSFYKLNFDAFKGDRFFEIKSVRKGGKVVIYSFRMEKERLWAEADKLDYVMVVHNVKGAKSNRQLWEGFEKKGVTLVVVPAVRVHVMAKKYPVKKIKKVIEGVGYSREGYREGYHNLPIKDLMGDSILVDVRRCTKYGFNILVHIVRVF